MTAQAERLAAAIAEAFASAKPASRPATTPPHQAYTERKLLLKAAFSGWVLGHSADLEHRSLAAAISCLTTDIQPPPGEIPAGDFVRHHSAGLASLKSAAIDQLSGAIEGKPLAAAASQLMALASLGQIPLVLERVNSNAEQQGFHAGLIRQQILRLSGRAFEASRLAASLIAAHPESAARWYVDTTFPFRRAGDPGLLYDPGSLSGPASVRACLTELTDRNDFATALEVADRHAGLIGGDLQLAMATLRVLHPVLPSGSPASVRLDEASEMLPPNLRFEYARLRRGMPPSELLSVLEKAVDLDLPVSVMQGMIGAVWNLVLRLSPVPGLADEAQAHLLGFARSLTAASLPVPKNAPLRPEEVLSETGHFQRCLAAKRFYRDRFARNPVQEEPETPAALLTPAARAFLRERPEAAAGLLLYGSHIMGVDELAYLPMQAAAALTGRDVLGLLRAQVPSELFLHESWAAAPPHGAGRSAILNIYAADDGAQTAQLLSHLRSGGILDIANDGLNAPGVRIAVPWIARPYALRSFPAQLAIATGSDVAFRTVSLDVAVAVEVVELDAAGRPSLDIRPVDLPPDQGTLRVRAMWLTQRLARLSRLAFSQDPSLFPADRLQLFGGIPSTPGLFSLDAWSSMPGVPESLVGWLAEPELPVPAPSETDRITPSGIREPALRMASLFLHFQADSPAHNDPERRFLDQHRVAFIGPQGEALLAAGLGAFAAGSLLCPIQSDVDPETAAVRIHTFDPDLILASASAWGGLLKTDPAFADRTVLIFEDGGGRSALEDLLLSFAPAVELPRFDPARPGFVVFTSGSDGLPKGVVVPAGVLSNASGLDRCAELQEGDRVCYLTRWDAVGLADLMACLRGGAEILLIPPGVLETPTALAAWLNRTHTDFLSAPVSLWRLLLRTQAWARGEGNLISKGLLWGEPITSSVTAALRDLAPDLTAFCIYGSSEVTFTAFGRIDQAPPGLTGSPGGFTIPGSRVSPVEGSEDKLTRIESPNAMTGYFHDLYRDNPRGSEPRNTAVIVSDVIHLHEEFVEVMGRSDSVFKSGGRRYSVRQFEKAAEDVPGVETALGFLDTAGETPVFRLAVQAAGADLAGLKRQLADAVARSASGGIRATEIVIVAAFPVMPSGKTDRQALLSYFSTSSAQLPEAVPEKRPPPADPTLRALYDWAVGTGICRPETFDQAARLPEFSSIDLLELSLLCEDLLPGGTPPGLKVLKDASWNDLARAIDAQRP